MNIGWDIGPDEIYFQNLSVKKLNMQSFMSRQHDTANRTLFDRLNGYCGIIFLSGKCKFHIFGAA